MHFLHRHRLSTPLYIEHLHHQTVQKKWLISRAEKLGFLLKENEFQTVQSKWYDFRKRSGAGSVHIRLLSVTFEGNLTVTDAIRFKETLCHGIGREKAYGQGLLTIARCHNVK